MIRFEAKCKGGCDLALASYYVRDGATLTYISNIFGRGIPEILSYNREIRNPDIILSGSRVNVPFSCDCLNGDFLGYTFAYVTQSDDTYDKIARLVFANLTNAYWLQRVNKYGPTQIPDFATINVTVNCSCGDPHVSKDYGLFATYPLMPGESLSSLAKEHGVPDELLRGFNPASDFSAGSGLVFVPAKESKCSDQCQALASYYMWSGSNLTFVRDMLNSSLNEIQSYNPEISNLDDVKNGTRVNVPFSCYCNKYNFLSHQFVYNIQKDDTYKLIAETYYANLTSVEMLQRFNDYDLNNLPDSGGQLNVSVNCSCGKKSAPNYGLFITYPLRPDENLSTIAAEFNLSEKVLLEYNSNSTFNSGSGLVFIPGKAGIKRGVIAGISVGGVAGALLLAGCIYVGFYRKKKANKSSFLGGFKQTLNINEGPGIAMEKASDSGPLFGSVSSGVTGITVDKSVEFTLEELSKATNEFSLANRIGQGGFGSVYYGELRGEKAAIKKMDMQASKEFLAELKVLTHVHHLNLVRLIGYCVEGSLFLVYEFIDNGNLSQHLRDPAREPLPWAARVQIALDSARGLEYIHEHTVPVYIHRDIKSANILIDRNFRAKVADFGLTKLTEVGSGSLQTRLVGTFGYMPPEYAQYGDVSTKIDVYAFGVVLYELISAKAAIVKTSEVVTESTGLVALFENVLNQPDPAEGLRRLVDPRIGDDYPLDSVLKVAQLARACTQENPQLRPSMRSIVVALMTLSSATEDWDVGSFYENQGMVNLMSGR
ncbi:Non-specific serine/threonine protein kinase [Bertholletia excelsa]